MNGKRTCRAGILVLGERMCTYFASNVKCSSWSFKFKFSAWTRAWDLECAEGTNCCTATRCHCAGERWSRLLCCVDLSSWVFAEWQEGEGGEGGSHVEKSLGSSGRNFLSTVAPGEKERTMELGRPSSLAEFSLDILEVCWPQAEAPSARGPVIRRE